MIAIALLISFSILNQPNPATAWSNGGYSSNPNDPDYGTHDWIAEHAMNFLPSNQSYWSTQNKNTFLCGTQAPDDGQASFQGYNGYGDTTETSTELQGETV